MAHRGPGAAANRPSAVINSQSNRSAKATAPRRRKTQTTSDTEH